nr:MAG TPA_asm: hypothetical protein [Caudoviricetes sp.]
MVRLTLVILILGLRLQVRHLQLRDGLHGEKLLESLVRLHHLHIHTMIGIIQSLRLILN